MPEELGELEAPEEEIQVAALQGQRKIYTINGSGARVAIATPVVYRNYEGQAQVPTLDGRVLGRVSKKFQVVDHAAAVQPFLEAGFSEVSLLHHHRAGRYFLAVLSNPKVRIKDRISWDADLYKGRGEVMLTVRVRNSLQAGVGMQASLGFFRVICQNGLVAKDLGLGDTHFSHTNFDPAKLRNWLADRLAELQGGRKELPERPSKILDWPLLQLRASIENRSTLESLPKFAKEAARGVLYNMQKWGREKLLEQLELLRAASTVSPLDLLNALTNAANQGPRGDVSKWGIYRHIDPLFGNLVQMVDIGAFVAGEKPFNLN